MWSSSLPIYLRLDVYFPSVYPAATVTVLFIYYVHYLLYPPLFFISTPKSYFIFIYIFIGTYKITVTFYIMYVPNILVCMLIREFILYYR